MGLDIPSLANQMVRLDNFKGGLSIFLCRGLIFLNRANSGTMIWDKVLSGEARKVTLYHKGILRIKGRIYVVRVGELVTLIL